MDWLSRLVISSPKTVIALTIAATIAFALAIAIQGISFDGSPQTLARSDHSLQFYDEVRADFGDDRVIIVAITTTDVFTPDFISRVSRLTGRLEGIAGVDEVMSLTNVKAILAEESGIVVDRLIPRNATAEQLATLKQTVIRDPLYARHYISVDGRTTAVNVFIKPPAEAESRAVAEEVERIAREHADGDEVLLAGVPILDARGIRSMLRDMLVISLMAALLCFAVFVFCFRDIWGAVLPMAALTIGVLWTIGTMSLAGRPITLATLSLPTTLLAVGSSFLFHVLNQHRVSLSQLGSDPDARSAREAWFEGLKFIGPSVLVSGTCTMAGFGALAPSNIPTVRDMGIFEALGVFFITVLCLTFVPATLTLLPPSHSFKLPSERKDYANWLNEPLRQITALILHRRVAVLSISILLTLSIGVGAWWLRANTDYLRIFPEGSDTVVAARKLHERLSGAATVQLVVSGAPGSALHPEFMTAVSQLQEAGLKQPGVDAALSVADIVKRFNSLLYPDRVEAIPKEADKLRYIFDEFLSQDQSLFRLVSNDRSRAIIVLKTNLYSSNELHTLTNSLTQWSAANLPTGMSMEPTGSFVLLNDASDDVAASQSESLAIALSSIYVMMVILFRSFKTALLALVPNLLPIICYFGFMGWAGIPLDITTSLVASAALGLAVDNAVHAIRRYRQCRSERGETTSEREGWAMWLTMHRTGKPMVLANLMLMSAFLIFVFSSFVPLRTAGILWAVTILACLGADLIFLPALMRTWPFAEDLTPAGETVNRLIDSHSAKEVS